MIEDLTMCELISQGYADIAWILRPTPIDESGVVHVEPSHPCACRAATCFACFVNKLRAENLDPVEVAEMSGGSKIVGRGKTKIAVATGSGLVVKVGPVDRVAKQARRLRRLHRAGAPVAEVIAFGHGWLSQQRCFGLLADRDRDVQHAVIGNLRDAVARKGYRVHDVHANNVMLLDGRWVLVDCGATRRTR